MGFKRKAVSLGADFVEGEVFDFQFAKNPNNVAPEQIPNRLLVKMSDATEQSITFKHCVIAAGAHSGAVAHKAGVGSGPGVLSVPLPVIPRWFYNPQLFFTLNTHQQAYNPENILRLIYSKRYVYVIKTQGQNAPDCNTPLTIDPNNTYVRPDGLSGNFLTGRSPDEEDEPDCSNLEVDYSYFENEVWPRLAHRVPAFESVKLQSAWSGYYEFNTFDENGIIGVHPYFTNLLFATGFSGHGRI